MSYDREARCPLWSAFLDRILDGNPHLIRFVQKALGYSLTGDVSEQAIFFLHGSGANGNNSVLSVINVAGTLIHTGSALQFNASTISALNILAGKCPDLQAFREALLA